jgi:hypothetical protein
MLAESSGHLDPSPPVPVEAKSRVRAHSFKEGGEFALKKTDVQVDKVVISPSRPREGVQSKELKRERVAQVVGGLKAKEGLRDLAKDPLRRSWRALLGGNIDEISSQGTVHPRIGEAMRQAGVSYLEGHTHTKTIDTGVDYSDLTATNPTGNYKFYHSFSNPDRATAYTAEVMKRAAEAGISFRVKTFDHDYDGINFYTQHFQELSDIIKEVYPSYAEAFGSTEHFLQGPIDETVDPSHIGWVQENVAGTGGNSHSGRMEVLGGYLDSQGFSEEAYRQGCAAAGVRPDAPWQFTAEYEQQLLASVATARESGM